MARAKTHRRVGTAVGAVTALANSKPEQALWKTAAETWGGYVGGDFGQGLPDILEPASTGSWHRGPAHSIGMVGSQLALMMDGVGQLSDRARRFADKIADERTKLPPGDPARIVLGLCEFVARAAAGFVWGVPAGYLSHLALDAATPRGLPLICRGC